MNVIPYSSSLTSSLYWCLVRLFRDNVTWISKFGNVTEGIIWEYAAARYSTTSTVLDAVDCENEYGYSNNSHAWSKFCESRKSLRTFDQIIPVPCQSYVTCFVYTLVEGECILSNSSLVLSLCNDPLWYSVLHFLPVFSFSFLHFYVMISSFSLHVL